MTKWSGSCDVAQKELTGGPPSESDGHTLLFTNTSGMAINLVSSKQLPYHPTRDLTAVLAIAAQYSLCSLPRQVHIANLLLCGRE